MATLAAVGLGALVFLPFHGTPNLVAAGERLRPEPLPTAGPSPTARPTAGPSSVPPVSGLSPNVRVTRDRTPGSYRRADGTVDKTTRACSTGRREQNEPSVAVDPRKPSVVAAGANELCTAIVSGDSWLGYYRSTDGGRAWRDSLVPGDPSDGTADGRASPAHGDCSVGSDPSLGFDPDGRLFYGFICFNRPERSEGQGFTRSSTFVATYDRDGGHYARTALLGQGSRTVDEDKINLAVDQTSGPHSGNVYAAWVELAPPRPGGFPQDLLRFTRSTDHGATFSRPQPLSDLHHATNPDIAVGPDGSVYVTFLAGGGIFLATSTDGGRTFAVPLQVDTLGFAFESFDFSGGSGRDCGDKPFQCATGYTFSRFGSYSTVAADESGVHVAWNDRLESSGQVGESKILVKSSPDGQTWTQPAAPVDHATKGHEYFPDMASSGGVITLAFYDSRNDPAYDPFGPPGNTKDGKSPGGYMDTYVARSSDGGATWTEQRVSDRSSNQNLEIPGDVPFWGDYIYVTVARGTTIVGWTDSRDVQLGSGGTGGKDGFDTYEPCFGQAYVNDPCLSKGGHDENIYVARI